MTLNSTKIESLHLRRCGSGTFKLMLPQLKELTIWGYKSSTDHHTWEIDAPQLGHLSLLELSTSPAISTNIKQLLSTNNVIDSAMEISNISPSPPAEGAPPPPPLPGLPQAAPSHL